MVLVRGEYPILLDSGYGSDLPETEDLLKRAGTPPESLSLVVNSHYHCDHAGGNSGLQRDHGVPVAAHRWEAELVNRRDREACGVEWLDQPIEPYRVERPLSDGHELDAGPVVLQVIETPGHTLGHVSLYAPEEATLLLGDAVHGDDVAWLNPFREGVGAAHRALESLDRLSTLRARRTFSGHGAEITDLPAAIDAGRRRYEKWLEEPERSYWHACKRIFGYALMIHGGQDEDEVSPYLLRCPWFQDYARHGFGTEPETFVEPLVAEMLRSKAAGWSGGRLVALPPHNQPPPGWPSGPTRPRDWPGTSRR
ncbi:MBL fold metallo-hydrolase [Rubrobacter marinus]|uniref:MBL fold metallo-hydrolase n=2 Tax=Rubrobacter marinus TaxID=2653852 RepID=A0A6G8Q2V2_9ACTN|nr:MBL fold metallo-hydrolase [Rubrobacter marinus]